MSQATDSVTQWSGKMKELKWVEWDRLPEIYLYMDQVLTYMDKQLTLFERDENDSLLTSSMINNYVKDGVLARPEQKKYSREHLAVLTVICMLKQVLSIQDISVLVKILLQDSSREDMYNRFCDAQDAALKEVCTRTEQAAAAGDAELTRLAIELSVEANARRTTAEKILTEIARQKAENEAETEKEKEKKK